MSEPLTVTIPHRLGKAEARRRIEPALATVSRTFTVLTVEEEIWAGDRLSFRVRALSQAASGTVTVEEEHVRLEVMLPWLLHRFAQLIQGTVRARAKILLEKK